MIAFHLNSLYRRIKIETQKNVFDIVKKNSDGHIIFFLFLGVDRGSKTKFLPKIVSISLESFLRITQIMAYGNLLHIIYVDFMDNFERRAYKLNSICNFLS